jgi:hypothetical protein
MPPLNVHLLSLSSSEQIEAASKRDDVPASEQRMQEWDAILRNFVSRFIQQILYQRTLRPLDLPSNGVEKAFPVVSDDPSSLALNRWFNLTLAEYPLVKDYCRQIYLDRSNGAPLCISINIYFDTSRDDQDWTLQSPVALQPVKLQARGPILLESWTLELSSTQLSELTASSTSSSLTMDDIEVGYKHLAVVVRAVHTLLRALPANVLAKRHPTHLFFDIRSHSKGDDSNLDPAIMDLSHSLLGEGVAEQQATVSLPIVPLIYGGDKPRAECSVQLDYRVNCQFRLYDSGADGKVDVHDDHQRKIAPTLLWSSSDDFEEIGSASPPRAHLAPTSVPVGDRKIQAISRNFSSLCKDENTSQLATQSPLRPNGLETSKNQTPGQGATASSSTINASSAHNAYDVTGFVKRLEHLCLHLHPEDDSQCEEATDQRDERVEIPLETTPWWQEYIEVVEPHIQELLLTYNGPSHQPKMPNPSPIPEEHHAAQDRIARHPAPEDDNEEDLLFPAFCDDT